MIPQDEPAKPEKNLAESIQTPKQIYMENIQKIGLDADMASKMATLFEIGFVEFETNHELLTKHKGNLEQVAGELSDQLLLKSTY